MPPDPMQASHAPEKDADVARTENKATPPSDASLPPMTLEEEAVLRAEKLRTIREAVENGAYDSDDILEIAMNRLRQTIEQSEKESDGTSNQQPPQ